MNKKTTALGLFLGSVAFAGCTTEVIEPEGTSSNTLVSTTTFDRAYSIVKAIDYLPFRYEDDGCYARALYMSMELAANRIESNAIFAFASDDKHELDIPGSNLTWAYHVAPMLMVGGTKSEPVARVLDPSMSKSPLTHTQWIKKMGYASDDPYKPLLRSVSGSEYVSAELLTDLKANDVWLDVPSFKAMPKFEVRDVQHACNTMHAYLTLEGSTSDLARAKQKKLTDRSRTLMTDLAAKGKLDRRASDFSAAACAKCRIVDDAIVCQ